MTVVETDDGELAPHRIRPRRDLRRLRALRLFHDAYVAELADFTECIRTGRVSAVTGENARAALSIALAAIQPVATGGPVRIDQLKDQ